MKCVCPWHSVDVLNKTRFFTKCIHDVYFHQVPCRSTEEKQVFKRAGWFWAFLDNFRKLLKIEIKNFAGQKDIADL